MKTTVKKTLCIISLLLVMGSTALWAGTVKRFAFTGVSRTEQVYIQITEDSQELVHLSPSGSTAYSILDYDISYPGTDDSVFQATVVDPLFNMAYNVVLYMNKAYSDIRIGKKRITFIDVRENTIEPWD